MQKKTLIIIISVLVIILAVIAIVLVVTKNSNGGMNSNSSSNSTTIEPEVELTSETENGITTIYVTDFTGKREGWTYRKNSLNNWQKKANVANMDKKLIDAVSKPTPKQGKVNIVWDCKDSNGQLLKDGSYKIIVEATIYQDNNVVYTSNINIGNNANSQKAEPKYSKKEAKDMDIIKNVNVSFMP